MALPKASVPRQASRFSSNTAERRAGYQRAPSMEDRGQPEAEEPTQVPTVSTPPRLTVNGVAVRRLQIDFGSNATAFTPTGSVMERFWDQRDNGPDDDKYSRPRAFGNARIEVDVSKGFMDLVVSWPDAPCITRLVQPSAHLNYEP